MSVTAVPRSGWGTLTYNYADALWHKNIPFILMLPRSAERISAPFAGCIRYILPDLPLTFSGYTAWRFIHRLYAPIRYIPEAGDIIHALTDFPYAAIAFRYARRHRLPFFMNAIGTYSVAPFRHFLDRLFFMPAYRGADRIIAISEYTKRRMIDAAGFFRPIDVMLLPVVRPVLEGHEDFSIYAKLPPHKRYVLTVSSPRAHGRKGFEAMAAAFKAIHQTMPDVHLVAIGGNAITTSAYTVIPKVSSAELGGLYARCALFAAMPHGTGGHFEGYGLVYREAGLYGKPVIGTLSGGVPEAVENGVTGFLVSENDIEEMSAVVRRLLSDAVLSARLGSLGRMQAEAYTWRDYVERMLFLYRSFSV